MQFGKQPSKTESLLVSFFITRNTLLGLPDIGFAIYIGLNCAIWSLLWFALQKEYGLDEINPHYLAFLASFGPLIIAQVMANITESSKSKRSIFYPFHKVNMVLESFYNIGIIHISIFINLGLREYFLTLLLLSEFSSI